MCTMLSHFVTKKEENLTYEGVAAVIKEGRVGCSLHLRVHIDGKTV